jgi:molybdopterin synthase catalytic subunit
MIRVQAEDFDVGAELGRLAAGRTDLGGLVSFVGLVRGARDGVRAMTLEHYPGMTEKALAGIAAEAGRRWPGTEVVVIHRYGRLVPGERIVFVGVAAAHRGEAFAACEFLVDWLKTQAPFWKLEEQEDAAHWVEARGDDDKRAARWEKPR